MLILYSAGFEGSNTPYMLRIPVMKACAFNFRLEFCFNFGLKLPGCDLRGIGPSTT